MTIENKIGLTLGKFAPFHKGHQFLVEKALKEVDKLWVVIYDCPETTNIPLTTRANWIRKLYPEVEVIEAWDGPTEIGYTPEIKKMHEDYILNLLDNQKITHFYSSEPYGEHMSIALNSKNCIADLERKKFNISGTKIRENPTKHKEFLEPIVYREYVTNVVFLGAPSSGKTTLSKELAKKHKTVWMPEYGREYWDKNQIKRRLTQKQLLEIAETHLEREENYIHKANKYLFTDTNAITTYMFSNYYHKNAHPKLKRLAEKCIQRYDLVFLCDINIPYDDTWDRSGDANRQIFQKQIIADLKERRIPYIELKGNLKQRIKKVERILKKYEKYANNVRVV
ncbi:MAG: AAA family ATPase [Nanoarchaeota archaeon]|nr:AAA family ATPase [Nanoarchaeota archaeon]MCG2717791.1 AAA family ATPase [Nanoarchaeota archaeon]